jgi:putative membrane protein
MLTWLRWLFPVGQSPVSGRLWLAALWLALYTAGVAVLDHFFFREDVIIYPNLHVLLGTVLGLFLAFRTNTAYDRWWEGRKLWGQLVNESRNLIIKVHTAPGIAREDVNRFGRLVVNFAHALKEHLREGVRPQQLSVYKGLTVEPNHVPTHIALQMRAMVSSWAAGGTIDRMNEWMFDRHIAALIDICGGCERIRRTPLAASYRTYIRQGIALYLITLPWGLVYQLDLWSIPAVMMVTYFMVGIEMIAEEVEEPFGRTEDDLMLDDLCRTIEDATKVAGAPAKGA